MIFFAMDNTRIVACFKRSILQSYLQVKKLIESFNSNTTIEFLQVDFSELKQEMIKMVTDWQHRFRQFFQETLKDTSKDVDKTLGHNSCDSDE